MTGTLDAAFAALHRRERARVAVPLSLAVVGAGVTASNLLVVLR